MLEAYKESRQKRLAVKHRRYNLKTAILYCFIDTAAYNARLYSFSGNNLDSLNSRKHTTYILAIYYETTAEQRRFSLSCLSAYFSTLEEAYKESRQKRLVEPRNYILKTSILQYILDKAANTLHYLGDISLDSLNFRKLTIYVRIYVFVHMRLGLVEAHKESRKKRLVVKVIRNYILKTATLQYIIVTAANTTRLYSLVGIILDSLSSPERNLTGERCCFLAELEAETYKESRQKRLAVKTSILQYLIDTTAARLHASGRTINGKSYH